jgi:hypothetical protein
LPDIAIRRAPGPGPHLARCNFFVRRSANLNFARFGLSGRGACLGRKIVSDAQGNPTFYVSASDIKPKADQNSRNSVVYLYLPLF